MKQASQSFLFPDILSEATQISPFQDTIQRTRKQCIYWNQINTRMSSCERDKDKRCRPAVCPDFILRKGLQ